eukprot:TRINITY_DN14830_c0_g1_i1.p2 TRINITY_DN14830_c0_g1~~TRINITY_DN14830_c0_g1_i1.p2  ORF type:complete len:76 (+),score=8.04 TRINITY_DN14830_c0_g1_i1:40-267(+)
MKELPDPLYRISKPVSDLNNKRPGSALHDNKHLLSQADDRSSLSEMNKNKASLLDEMLRDKPQIYIHVHSGLFQW